MKIGDLVILKIKNPSSSDQRVEIFGMIVIEGDIKWTKKFKKFVFLTSDGLDERILNLENIDQICKVISEF
jgi:hypothetical protein